MGKAGKTIGALVVPPSEKALGRKVNIGDIDVSILSGISSHDFAIKEADGQADFLSARVFVLDYDLLPLLQKKLMVREIRIEEPVKQLFKGLFGR